MDRIQELLDTICGNNYTTEWRHLNYKRLPISVINAVIGSETEFNELYQELLKSSYKQIKRTKSGGISVDKQQRLYNHYVYDVKQYNSVVEITISKPVQDIMRTYRIQYRSNNYKEEEQEKLISGTVAFRMFERALHNDGIELSNYAVLPEIGKKINSEIHKPDIRLMNPLWTNRTFENTCHLDFHKFYISGLAASHPEFRYTIERLAQLAKTQPVYKTVLAATIGYMHSPACHYKYANLARDAINNAYTRFDAVLKLLMRDKLVIATNTDGIWYKGDPWHGPFETEDLCGWSNDHICCKLRFKSAGSYEFIENGVYYPVVRGRTNLDKFKDRSEWKWGDIFDISAVPQAYTFKKGVGIVWQKVM